MVTYDTCSTSHWLTTVQCSDKYSGRNLPDKLWCVNPGLPTGEPAAYSYNPDKLRSGYPGLPTGIAVAYSYIPDKTKIVRQEQTEFLSDYFIILKVSQNFSIYISQPSQIKRRKIQQIIRTPEPGKYILMVGRGNMTHIPRGHPIYHKGHSYRTRRSRVRYE